MIEPMNPVYPAARATRRRWLRAGAGLAVACLVCSPGAAQSLAKPLPRTVAWPAEVRLLGGGQIDGSALNTRPVVAVFWSHTCPFCQRHNAHVEKLHRAAAGSRLLVLGIAVDGSRAQIEELVRREGYTFPVTRDAAALAAMFDTRRVTPRTYAVEAGSRLVAALPGEMFEDDVMELLRLARPS